MSIISKSVIESLVKKAGGIRDSLSDKLKGVGLDTKSTWSSSKLWILLGVVSALIFLAHGQLGVILDPMMKLTGLWMIIRGVEDIVAKLVDGSIRKSALTLLAKDGLTTAEVDDVLKPTDAAVATA